MKETLWIHDVTAVTMQDECPVIEHANIVIEGNRITYLGTERPEGSFDREIDGRGKVAMPGLINAHTHTAMTVLRSYADDMNLQDWLFQKIVPYEDTMTEDVVYRASINGIMEMLASGTTCFHDMYFFQEETAKAAKLLGMRGVLNEGITDSVLNVKLKKTERLFNIVENSGGRLRVGVSPHAVYACSLDTLRRCAAFAKEHGLRIHTHLSETKKENIDCEKEYGMSPTALMEECGLMELPLSAAHGVWLSEKDLEILKKHDAAVVHNPVSNLKLASGVANVPAMRKRGITVALGTDGASSNNNLDLFEEIKLTGILHKGISYDPTALPAWEVLKMATVGGARVLGFSDLGMIKTGYLADVILLDFQTPRFVPNHDTVANLVYTARGSDVVCTIVDGKIVYTKEEKIRFTADQVEAETLFS